MDRTNRYLPIRQKIAECEEKLQRIDALDKRVNQLIAVEKLLATKRNMKNI